MNTIVLTLTTHTHMYIVESDFVLHEFVIHESKQFVAYHRYSMDFSKISIYKHIVSSSTPWQRKQELCHQDYSNTMLKDK